MNAVLWALHLGVLCYSLPVLREWWCQRKRWLVVLSVGMPPIAALWLVPARINYGWRMDERERERANAEAHAKRLRDIAYWREQAASGDLLAAMNAAELLELWGVPVVEPVSPSGFEAAVPLKPVALPGAHPYLITCECRNCDRARVRLMREEFDTPTDEG